VRLLRSALAQTVCIRIGHWYLTVSTPYRSLPWYAQQDDMLAVIKEGFRQNGTMLRMITDSLSMRTHTTGPPDTPYDGGMYQVDVMLPDGMY